MTRPQDIGRIGFDHTLDVSQIVLSVDRIRDMDDRQCRDLVSILSRYGIAVIEYADTDDPRAQSIALGRLFGAPVNHNRADAAGIVPINPMNQMTGYLGSTNQEHPLHTDGAFSDCPEKIMTLNCEIPAARGGETILVSGQAVYDHLAAVCPASLPALFRPDAMTVTRMHDTSTKPVFWREHGRLHMCFRADTTAKVTIHPDALAAFDALYRFVQEPCHQLVFTLAANQIAVVDNVGVLHGRTAFPPGLLRKLHRLNFDNTGLLARRLQLGIEEAVSAAVKAA